MSSHEIQMTLGWDSSACISNEMKQAIMITTSRRGEISNMIKEKDPDS